VSKLSWSLEPNQHVASTSDELPELASIAFHLRAYSSVSMRWHLATLKTRQSVHLTDADDEPLSPVDRPRRHTGRVVLGVALLIVSLPHIDSTGATHEKHAA
jgi:hypothetical protein